MIQNYMLALRDSGHKSVLALIPGTMEQLQAEMLALKGSMRNMQMGQEGGARINVPECPVIWTSCLSLFSESGVFWRDGTSEANLPLPQWPLNLCVDHAGLTFRCNGVLHHLFLLLLSICLCAIFVYVPVTGTAIQQVSYSLILSNINTGASHIYN